MARFPPLPSPRPQPQTFHAPSACDCPSTRVDRSLGVRPAFWRLPRRPPAAMASASAAGSLATARPNARRCARPRGGGKAALLSQGGPAVADLRARRGRVTGAEPAPSSWRRRSGPTTEGGAAAEMMGLTAEVRLDPPRLILIVRFEPGTPRLSRWKKGEYLRPAPVEGTRAAVRGRIPRPFLAPSRRRSQTHVPPPRRPPRARAGGCGREDAQARLPPPRAPLPPRHRQGRRGRRKVSPDPGGVPSALRRRPRPRRAPTGPGVGHPRLEMGAQVQQRRRERRRGSRPRAGAAT